MFTLVFKKEIELYRASLGVFETNCYILVHTIVQKALVVDPGDEGFEIYSFCRSQGWEIETIFLTHGHWDHIGGVNELRKQTEAPVLIHEADASMLTDAHLNLSIFIGDPFCAESADSLVSRDAQLKFGPLMLNMLHVPGHTRGSVCLYTNDILIAGDTLFKHNVGRTDLPGGNENQLMHAIQTKLLALPDSTTVFPGHGPETTIEEEKKIQAYLWRH